jgi:hypothetical protein
VNDAAPLGRQLLACLRGVDDNDAGGSDGDARRVADLVERGDVDAAVLRAHQLTLGPRVRAALAADSVEVVVADGTALSLAAAERQLVNRESDRVFVPLRVALARAQAPHDRPFALRSAWRAALALPEPAAPSTTAAALRAFLLASRAVGEAAREVLGDLGGVDVDSGVTLERALDLPEPALFGEPLALALAKAAKAALPKDAAALLRVAVPRALAGGIVVDDGASDADADGAAGAADGARAVRLLWATPFRAARFAALMTGLGRALVAAIPGAAPRPGLSLLATEPAARRAIGDDKAAATRAFHVVVARAIVDARAAAAGALVVADGVGDIEEERERARQAVRDAVGIDVGDGPAVARLLAPLPDGQRVQGAAVAVVDEAIARAAAATDAHAVRDALDEGAVVRRGRLDALRELPAVVVDEAAGAAWASAWERLLL